MVSFYDEMFSIVITKQGPRFALKSSDENDMNVIEQLKEIVIDHAERELQYNDETYWSQIKI
jgi:hypothetical protein